MTENGDTATDLVKARQAELAALEQTQESEFDDGDFQVPILKVTQSLTREVQEEEVEAGEFWNTLTAESYGDSIEFIIAYYQRGRSARNNKTGDYYVAFGATIPERWAELVGEEFVGTRFDEYPDAEERFKERVNAKEIEWGHGPLVSTTHNYTGLVALPAEEDSDDDLEYLPVRLTLKRTDMPGVRKIRSLKEMKLRNKHFWEKAFNLSTFKKSFPSGPAYIIQPKIGRETTAQEQELATELALAVAAGRVGEAGTAEEERVAPEARGGLAV